MNNNYIFHKVYNFLKYKSFMKINIRVRTNAGEQGVEKISDENYKVSLKSVPENGKANLELVKVLRKFFGRDIKIISGLSSRRKVVEVLESSTP